LAVVSKSEGTQEFSDRVTTTEKKQKKNKKNPR